MIKSKDNAAALRGVLQNLEDKRTNLENAPDEELIDRANEYEEARREATPVFGACQDEFAATEAPESPASAGDAAEAPAPEASPGVPLVQPPGVLVTAENIGSFGPSVEYQSKEDESVKVQATPYAFDTGTAVLTEDGEVATSQPMRVIIKGDVLGLVANDVFNQAYDAVPQDAPAGEPPADAQPGDSAPADPPAEEPAADAAESNGGTAETSPPTEAAS